MCELPDSNNNSSSLSLQDTEGQLWSVEIENSQLLTERDELMTQNDRLKKQLAETQEKRSEAEERDKRLLGDSARLFREKTSLTRALENSGPDPKP